MVEIFRVNQFVNDLSNDISLVKLVENFIISTCLRVDILQHTHALDCDRKCELFVYTYTYMSIATII